MDELPGKSGLRVNAYASEPHYLNKLINVWDELSFDLKGEFTVHPRLDGAHDLKGAGPNQGGLLMVASAKDSKWAKGRFIYVEHGVGQTYAESQWYSNHYRPGMLAALVPGPYCAEKTQNANPGVPVIPIGAPHLREIGARDRDAIVLAFHWRCSVANESQTAFDEYEKVLPELTKRFTVYGHGHPRIMGELIPRYQALGITPITQWDLALKKAALVIADNTSFMYEAAALDIPVIALNASTYRKDKKWGLRFWDAIPGPQIDEPYQLLEAVERQMSGAGSLWQDKRKEVTSLVYGPYPFTQLPGAMYELEKVIDAYSALPH